MGHLSRSIQAPLPSLIFVSVAGDTTSGHASARSSQASDSASSNHPAPIWRRGDDSSLSSGADSYAHSDASSVTNLEADSEPASVSDTSVAPAVAWAGSALATAVLETSLWAETGGPTLMAKADRSTQNGVIKCIQHEGQPLPPESGEPAIYEAYKAGTEPGKDRDFGLHGVPGEADMSSLDDSAVPGASAKSQTPGGGTGGLY